MNTLLLQYWLCQMEPGLEIDNAPIVIDQHRMGIEGSGTVMLGS